MKENVVKRRKERSRVWCREAISHGWSLERKHGESEMVMFSFYFFNYPFIFFFVFEFKDLFLLF